MKTKVIYISLFCFLILNSCASLTKVVPAGKDTYLISGDDPWGVMSGTKIKSKLYQIANSHCESLDKKLAPQDELSRGYSAELRFRCLNETDPDYVRPVMKSVPDVTIQNN